MCINIFHIKTKIGQIQPIFIRFVVFCVSLFITVVKVTIVCFSGKTGFHTRTFVINFKIMQPNNRRNLYTRNLCMWCRPTYYNDIHFDSFFFMEKNKNSVSFSLRFIQTKVEMVQLHFVLRDLLIQNSGIFNSIGQQQEHKNWKIKFLVVGSDVEHIIFYVHFNVLFAIVDFVE